MKIPTKTSFLCDYLFSVLVIGYGSKYNTLFTGDRTRAPIVGLDVNLITSLKEGRFKIIIIFLSSISRKRKSEVKKAHHRGNTLKTLYDKNC